MSKYSYQTGYITHVGKVRSVNQDSLLIRRGSIDGQDFLLLAVADGMGGMSRGEVASGCATGLLDQWWSEQLPQLLSHGLDWQQVENSLTVAVERINSTIRQSGQENPGQAGTTLTMAFVYQGEYLLFQVGDSRAYLVWDGSLRQLTRDQTWCAREVEAGRLSREEAAVHPMRHMLISTLGVRPEYILERLRGKIPSGSGLLLCSDGFYQELNPEWLGKNSPASVQTLLDQVLAQELERAASDNITAILVRAAKSWR
ncbi:PP2C family protein-serine/threonine phosphatase [Angelakisella massiliensis]|uniref:PP2C family protein-serine/threonine phosphatase n=1 Tax=Angelakisella massiliensis TaxID=1871018 RepID=UPI0023A7CD90|nr:protein phosphatase 2C domain-containing protein [Angelakisella massiliensis]